MSSGRRVESEDQELNTNIIETEEKYSSSAYIKLRANGELDFFLIPPSNLYPSTMYSIPEI